MGAYIDRKQALSHPFANGKYDHEHANEHFILGFESYREWLEQLSTIDLIRCGECKHWTGDCTNEIWQSPTDDYLPQTNADDFCSYGERRAE